MPSDSVVEPPLATVPAALLSCLNDAQLRAVLHGTDRHAPWGPLLVIAGAGSGKTTTLAHRLAHLVALGADPQRILLLTFSRRAAYEMEQRAGQAVMERLGLHQQSRPALPWSGTFHSVGARLLRDYAERIGLSPHFTVHDRADSEDLMALARHELHLSETKSRFPAKGTCLAIYSRTVNSQEPLCDVLARQFPWCVGWEEQLKQLFQRYVAEKEAQQALDYDDLLLYWAHLVEDRDWAKTVGDRFDHVLVDEYQDTNRLQSSILHALKPDGMGVTVVGDDAQAIYSFRAASVRNILDFPGRYSPTATVVTLEQNYRSTHSILVASNAVIGLAPERFTKNLFTDRDDPGPRPQLVHVRDDLEQARYVADAVLALREGGLRLRDQAALFRTSSHAAGLELELTRRNIPFVKFGGLKFLEAAHVKDLLALLRWSGNPKSKVSGFRVAQLLPGMGPANAAQLMASLANGHDVDESMAAFRPANPAAQSAWTLFAPLWKALRAPDAVWPVQFEIALDWYAAQLERLFENPAPRLLDLQQLSRMARAFGTRERFVTELTIDPPAATSDEAGAGSLDEDYMILSTIHSAKGQEWKSVSVLNAVDGCIPSDLSTSNAADLEEERRLLYVAMTRAKEHLSIVVPQRFYVHQQAAGGDRHVYGARTRFIPDALCEHFETITWPVAVTPDKAPGVTLAAPTDLRGRARKAWE